MTSGLFSGLDIRGVAFRNRIAMSPMCMYSCLAEDGTATPWHTIHYASRASGGAGLIIVEATSVAPEGRISNQDLGIWSDDHARALREVTAACRREGARTGIQLAHAGRKSMSDGRTVAPSAIAFDERSPVPEEMSAREIAQTVAAFREGARRAKEAGFDVIELHAAHGYLLNEFLSPLANKRGDAYGGSREGRFRMLGETILAVRELWSGPLFLRLSLDEYAPGGNTMEDFVWIAKEAKALGVDLIDCSSGAVVPARIAPYPGYQVPYAERIRREADIAVGAVGLISEPAFAEHLVRAGRADLVLLGRELLRDPYWPLRAAKALGVQPPVPKPYERGWM